MVGWHAAVTWTRQLWPALVSALLVLAVGISGSVMLARGWADSNRRTLADTINRRIVARTGLLASAAHKVDDLMAAQAAYVRAVSDGRGLLGHAQFANYITALDIAHQAAGLRSAAWVVPVPEAQVGGVLAELRGDGRPQLDLHPAISRPVHYLVTEQEPATTYAGSWGLDLGAYPTAVAALDRARDTGRPTTTGGTGAGNLVSALSPADSTGDAVGLVVPVYRTGEPASTMAQRRTDLLGWVVGQLQLGPFLTMTLRTLTSKSSVKEAVYAQLYPAGGGGRPVATYPLRHGDEGLYRQGSSIMLGGDSWPLRFGPTPAGLQSTAQSATPTQGLLAGVSVSALIAVLIVLLGAQTWTNRALARSSRRNADLVGVLTHDARQPLSTIIGFSTLILDDWTGMPDEQKRRDLAKVLDSAQHLGRLVDDMLSLARLDLAAAASHPRPVAIAPVIRDVATDLAIRLTDVDLSEVDSVQALVDPTHLRQMLTNLMSNGLKYGRPPVLVSTRLREDDVVIEVRDQGEGVPEAFVNQLFDRFTRATTGVASTLHGTGFGLYVVRRLAETNGGAVEYRANVPTGACFVLRLPAAPVSAPVGQPA